MIDDILDDGPDIRLSSPARHLILGWENRSNEDLDLRKVSPEQKQRGKEDFEERVHRTWPFLLVELSAMEIISDDDLLTLFVYVSARMGMPFSEVERIFEETYAIFEKLAEEEAEGEISKTH